MYHELNTTIVLHLYSNLHPQKPHIIGLILHSFDIPGHFTCLKNNGLLVNQNAKNSI